MSTTSLNPNSTKTNFTLPQPRRRARQTLNRLALALVGVMVGVVGQYFFSQNSLAEGLLFYAIAVILFVWAMAHQMSFSHAPSTPQQLGIAPGRWRQLIAVLLLAIALGSSYLGYGLFAKETNNAHAWWVYLFSLLLFISGTLILTENNTWLKEFKYLFPNRRVAMGLLIILAVAMFMRLFNFSQQPFGIWYDEADAGLQARQILNDPNYRPIFYMPINVTGHFLMLYALALKWFGDSVQSMRLVSVTFGLGGVIVAYLFGRELRGPRFGLVMAFLLAVARWHVNFSRIAMTGVDAPFFELLSLFFLVRLLRRGKLRDALGAGLSLGFGLMFYTAFRLYLITLSIFILLKAVHWFIILIETKFFQKKELLPQQKKKWLVQLLNLIILCITSLLVVVPLIRFFQDHPQEFSYRIRQTSILTKRDQTDLNLALWQTTQKHLLMFNYKGDNNGRHNLPGEPMLDPIMAVFFVLGLGLAIAKIRQPVNLFFLILFPVALSGGIFSLDFEAPQSLRSIAVIPAVIYFIALALSVLGREAEQVLKPLSKKWLVMPTAIVASLLIYFNGYTYFVRQANDFASWNAFSTPETIVGKKMAALEPNYIYFTSPFLTNHPSIRFLAPQVKDQRRLTLPDALPIRESPAQPIALFIHPDDEWIFKEAQRLYPNAQFEIASQEVPGGPPVIYFVNLQPQDLASIQGLELRYRPTDESKAVLFPHEARRVQNINVTWPDDVPAMFKENQLPFLGEWQGVLYVSTYGPHSFRLLTPAHSSLEIDGNIMLEGQGELITGFSLAQGNHLISLKVDGISDQTKGQIALFWQPPAQSETLIPSWAFYVPPVSNHGLLGIFYANDHWEGQPVLERIDPFLDVYFHFTPLKRPYSAEWTGSLIAPQNGLYKLGLKAITEAQLSVDGQAVVATLSPNQLVEETLNLEAGLHKLSIRFLDNMDRSQIHLYWTAPSGVFEPIPSQNLWPPMGQYPQPQIVSLPTPISQSLSLRWVTSIGAPGREAGQFSEPRDVAVLSNGNLVIADTANKRVQILDPQGNFIQALNGDPYPFEEPLAVAVNSQDEIFVLESTLQWIYRYNATGQFINRFGGPEARLFHPRGLTVFADDTIAVADTGGARFVLFGTDGTPMGSIGGLGKGPGQFNEPVDVLRDVSGTYFVAEAENKRIQRVDAMGNPLGQWAISSAFAYDGPHLAFGPDGSIFVTESQNHSILRYAPDGNLLDQWQTIDALHLVMPVGIYFDETTHRLYVTDIWMHQVHVLEVVVGDK